MKESSYPLLPWLRQIVYQNCFSGQFIDSSRCGQEKMELNEENKRNLVCVWCSRCGSSVASFQICLSKSNSLLRFSLNIYPIFYL